MQIPTHPYNFCAHIVFADLAEKPQVAQQEKCEKEEMRQGRPIRRTVEDRRG